MTIEVICPHCEYSHKKADTLISWNWPCENCGKVFRWHAYDDPRPPLTEEAIQVLEKCFPHVREN